MKIEELTEYEIYHMQSGSSMEAVREGCGSYYRIDDLPPKTAISEEDKPLDNEIVALYWDDSKSAYGWRFGAKWFTIFQGQVILVAKPTHFRELLI